MTERIEFTCGGIGYNEGRGAVNTRPPDTDRLELPMRPQCTVPDCDLPLYCRERCNRHYLRAVRHGEIVTYKIPTPTPEVKRANLRAAQRRYARKRFGWAPRKDEVVRFWKKVEKTDTCWLWTGTKRSDGYGRFFRTGAKLSTPVHRYAYELLVGTIPDGLTIDHVYAYGCRNRHCVNPNHLEPVTRAVNTHRAAEVRRAK